MSISNRESRSSCGSLFSVCDSGGTRVAASPSWPGELLASSTFIGSCLAAGSSVCSKEEAMSDSNGARMHENVMETVVLQNRVFVGTTDVVPS